MITASHSSTINRQFYQVVIFEMIPPTVVTGFLTAVVQCGSLIRDLKTGPKKALKSNEMIKNLRQAYVALHESLSKDGNPAVDQLRSVMKALQPLLDQSAEAANGNLFQLLMWVSRRDKLQQKLQNICVELQTITVFADVEKRERQVQLLSHGDTETN